MFRMGVSKSYVLSCPDRDRMTNKKADVVKHPQVFHHVGLLDNESPGLGRDTLYLVFR